MKYSLISLIALALTSTSVMAAAQPVAVDKRALDSVTVTLLKQVPKGRKFPLTTGTLSSGFYFKGNPITIICYTEENTTPVNNDV
jgi:hypothetical protein